MIDRNDSKRLHESIYDSIYAWLRREYPDRPDIAEALWKEKYKTIDTGKCISCGGWGWPVGCVECGIKCMGG